MSDDVWWWFARDQTIDCLGDEQKIKSLLKLFVLDFCAMLDESKEKRGEKNCWVMFSDDDLKTWNRLKKWIHEDALMWNQCGLGGLIWLDVFVWLIELNLCFLMEREQERKKKDDVRPMCLIGNQKKWKSKLLIKRTTSGLLWKWRNYSAAPTAYGWLVNRMDGWLKGESRRHDSPFVTTKQLLGWPVLVCQVPVLLTPWLNPMLHLSMPSVQNHLNMALVCFSTNLGNPCIERLDMFEKFHRPHPCKVELFRIWQSFTPGEEKGEFNVFLDHQVSSSSEPQDQSGSKNMEPSTNCGGDDWNCGFSKARSYVHWVKLCDTRRQSGPLMELLDEGKFKND